LLTAKFMKWLVNFSDRLCGLARRSPASADRAMATSRQGVGRNNADATPALARWRGGSTGQGRFAGILVSLVDVAQPRSRPARAGMRRFSGLLEKSRWRRCAAKMTGGEEAGGPAQQRCAPERPPRLLA
jgi:hypothetical protein